jgi:hypothetical protein
MIIPYALVGTSNAENAEIINMEAAPRNFRNEFTIE